MQNGPFRFRPRLSFPRATPRPSGDEDRRVRRLRGDHTVDGAVPQAVAYVWPVGAEREAARHPTPDTVTV